MKLQVQGQTVRLRLSEQDLQTLLSRGECADRSALGPLGDWSRVLQLADIEHAECEQRGGEWSLRIPRAAFAAFAAERPRRDGLQFELWPEDPARALRVSVEIDVRDSTRQRGPR